MRQRKMNKVLSLLLAAVMLLSLVPTALALSKHITVTDQSAAEIAAGEQYKLDLTKVFADSDGHGLSYAVTDDAANKSTTALKDGVYYFTTPTAGTYTPTITATCSADSGETASVKLKITVKDGGKTYLDLQYGYEETPADKVTVYVTMSSDGIPIMSTDGTVLSHLKVTVPYFDLKLYGLEDFYRYATENGRGAYVGTELIKRPTGLHLYIYLLERFYIGLDEKDCGKGKGKEDIFGDSLGFGVTNMLGDEAYEDSESPLQITGSATSMYMKNFWGHDENLMYYRNHCYPLMSDGWGATADYALLSDGDTIDLAMFSNWSFWTSGAFCVVAAEGSKLPSETLTVKQGNTLHFSGLKFGTQSVADGGTDAFVSVTKEDGMVYRCYDQNWKEVAVATNASGSFNGHFALDTKDLTPGTYHLVGMQDTAGSEDAAIAPATCDIVVTERVHGDQNDDGKCDYCGEKIDRAPRLAAGVQDVKGQAVVGSAYLLSDLQKGKIFTDPDGDTLSPTPSGDQPANIFYQRSTDGGKTWSQELGFTAALFGGTTLALTETEPGVYTYRFYAKSYQYDENGSITKVNSSADAGQYWTVELKVDKEENLDFDISFYIGKDQSYSANIKKNPIIKLYPSLGTDENGQAVADYDNPVEFLDSDFAAAENADRGYMDSKTGYNTMYATVKGGWYVYEGFGWNAETKEYDIPLGGMQIKLPADRNVDGAAAGGTDIYLRVMAISATNKTISNGYFGAEDFTVRVNCPIMQCDATMGTPYKSGNNTYYPTLFYAGGNACLFNFYLNPTDTDNYIFSQAINQTLTAANSVQTKNGSISAAMKLEITVPQSAQFGLYFQYNNFNTSEQKPVVDWTENANNTKTATFHVAKGNGNYTWRMSDTTGTYVTRAGWLSGVSKDTELTFSFENGYTDKLSHDFSKLGTQTSKRDEADLQVFADPTGSKALGGATERIRAYRMWQLINSDTANIMVEPDYIWSKLSGPAEISFVDDDAEITGNQVDSGNGRHNWADISANGGTSIFAVRYDAIDMDTSNNTTHAGLFPATNPDRVSFVVVADELGTATANVPFNGDFSSNARLDGWDYIYDTWYYLRSNASPALTFTTTDAVKVEYAYGLTDGETMKSSVSEFKTLSAVDGTYSVPLQIMNNAANNYGGTVILRMTDADGKYSYQLVKAAGINYTVENLSFPGEPVMPGCQVKVSFDGLYRSVNKISGIFNPTTFQLRYTVNDQEIKGTTNQYQQMDSTTLTFTVPENITFPDGENTTTLTATNGYVYGSMYSAANPFGAMYNMTDVGVGTNFNAVMVAYAFQNVCDLPLSVEKMPTTSVKLNVSGAEDYTVTVTDTSGKTMTALDSVYSLGFGTYYYTIKADGRITEMGKFTVGRADEGEKTVSVALRQPDATTWDGTTVTPVTPNADGVYEITTGAELAWFAQRVNSGAGAEYKAKLMNDLSLNCFDWTPIGNSNKAAFKGTFDGNGHVIRDLYINATSPYQGLFGYISDATIRNLGVTGSVTSTGNLVGGIFGYGAGKYVIENCFNAADVKGAMYVGGIGGGAYSTGTVKNCYNLGDVTATSRYAGGITANTSNPVAVNCFNLGKITSPSSFGAINPNGAKYAENCYYLDSSCVGGAASGTAKTAAEMSGVDFAKLLGDAFVPVANRAYPVLKWQTCDTHPDGAIATVNAKAATCTENGYTGDEACSVCGEIIKQGEVIPASGHSTELKNTKAATCTENGYTGDEVCKTCGETVKQGAVIPASGHSTELKNAKAATCTENGYTGDEVCKTCGETVKRGEVILASGHSFKDGKCTACGASDPDYKPADTGVKTGDTGILLWVAMASLTTLAGACVLNRKKKNA